MSDAIALTLDQAERDCLRSEAGLALAVAVDTLGQEQPDDDALLEAREDTLAVAALLECIGWDLLGFGEYEVTMPRDQLAAFLARRRESRSPESLGWHTMISDETDAETQAEWRRHWHETARILRDVAERVEAA